MFFIFKIIKANDTNGKRTRNQDIKRYPLLHNILRIHVQIKINIREIKELTNFLFPK